MLFVEVSLKAFAKGLSDEAMELLLPLLAQRLGAERAQRIVAPEMSARQRPSVTRHHEMVQTEFSCVSEEPPGGIVK